MSSLFVIVSNGSSHAFSPPNTRNWKTMRKTHNINMITTTPTSESADAIILQLVSSCFDPCTAKYTALKPDEKSAYGCSAENSDAFSVARLYKADVLVVSTGDYHLVSLLAAAFLQNNSNNDRTLVFMVPSTNTSKTFTTKFASIVKDQASVIIDNFDLGQQISAAKGKIMFVTQTQANAQYVLTAPPTALRKQFKGGTYPNVKQGKSAYMFSPISSPKQVDGTSTSTRAVIIDADDSENASAFRAAMGLSTPQTTHTFKDNQAKQSVPVIKPRSVWGKPN